MTWSLLARFTRKYSVCPESDCWLWHKPHGDGYGTFYVGPGQRTQRAHRVAWELFVGPIPADLEPDHLCRRRRCVNPWHMELVTHRENVLRGAGIAAARARQTHCKHGHEFTDENTIRTGNLRRCRECTRRIGREWAKRNYQSRGAA